MEIRSILIILIIWTARRIEIIEIGLISIIFNYLNFGIR